MQRCVPFSSPDRQMQEQRRRAMGTLEGCAWKNGRGANTHRTPTTAARRVAQPWRPREIVFQLSTIFGTIPFVSRNLYD